MPTPPQALPQFQHIKRYWDPSRKLYIAKIMPGEVYVTKHHELISTLLGSCIAVCMRDHRTGVGGMNHFKLPAAPGNNNSEVLDSTYGLYAMELLINGILKNGGKRQNLEANVYGGGNVIATLESKIGSKNIVFVTEFLQQENIPVINQHTGGSHALRVYYHPLSGNGLYTNNDETTTDEVKKSERLYLEKLNQEMEKSNITYF